MHGLPLFFFLFRRRRKDVVCDTACDMAPRESHMTRDSQIFVKSQ